MSVIRFGLYDGRVVCILAGIEERFSFGGGSGRLATKAAVVQPADVLGFRAKQIGKGYHVNWIQVSGVYLIEINSDDWKTFVRQRLSTPIEQPGSMTLFQTAPQEHLALAKRLTAEAKVEEFVAGNGIVTRW